MKKLLCTLLSVIIIFSACEEEDTVPSTNNNTGTIADVVGVWNYKGHYDALGNLVPFPSIEYENCALQGTINLELDGDLVITDYELKDDCGSESYGVSYNYINSTTLEFIIPLSHCGNPTVILVSSTEFHLPACSLEGGDEALEGSYALYEKQ